MRLAASSFEVPDGLLATRTTAQLNPKPHQGLSSKNPASHPALDDANSTTAIGLRAGLVLNGIRQSERARYYGSALGRFTSPDWSATPQPVPYANLIDPQTLNLYAYVRNNPLAKIDPDGHYVCSGSKENCTAAREALRTIRDASKSQNLSKQESAALKKVLNFYGKEGKDNGVTVTFQQGAEGERAGGTSTQNGRTTVSLSLSDVASNPIYSQNGANPRIEAGAQVAHEGEHGVQQRDSGMPQSRAQEKAGEVQACTVDSYVNKGLWQNSAYGTWTIQGRFNADAVNQYAEDSTRLWCQGGGNCH